jgi:hypothetical protein
MGVIYTQLNAIDVDAALALKKMGNRRHDTRNGYR